MSIDPKIQELLHRLEELPVGDYSTPLSFSKIIFDQSLLHEIESVYERLEGSTVTDVVLVGIGGSHFGVQAIYDALYAHQYVPSGITFHALTSIDSFHLEEFITWYKALLHNPARRVMLCVVSKTGATFETAAHASLCFDLLKTAQPKTYARNMVVITDRDSPLWHAARSEGLSCLGIPGFIGGRYSVFSAAGLGVLRFLCADITGLLAGAQAVDLKQPSATAQELYRLFTHGYLVHDMFIFMPAYASLGGWTRQLIGESLGKDSKGFLPTVSLGSQDLHSVIQQYFGGKQMTITSFLLPAEYISSGPLPETLFSYIGKLPAGLSCAGIQQAIVQGVQRSYDASGKPYFTFKFNRGSAADIGYYMQYRMLETVYLGTLMELNPFDQPQVERYKKETRLSLAELFV